MNYIYIITTLVRRNPHLLLHDFSRVPPELLPLPGQPLPPLTIVVQEAAQIPQFVVILLQAPILLSQRGQSAEAVVKLGAEVGHQCFHLFLENVRRYVLGMETVS